jgi:antitoxin VapB
MALNIKKPDAEADIRELAALTGQSLTDAIQSAVQEKLQRLKKTGAGESLQDYLAAIRPFQDALKAKRIDPNDRRTGKELEDELYDEHGLPA